MMHLLLSIDSHGILCFAAVCTLLGLSLLLAARFLNRGRGLMAVATALIGLGLGSPLAWSYCLNRQTSDFDPSSALSQIGDAHGSRASLVALTDRGRVIPLSEFHAAIDVEAWAEAEDRRYAEMGDPYHFIRLAPPNPICNCHGWVFADGQFWIDGNDVKNILDDNGYYEVTAPVAGDIIVYHAGDEVLHSGIVRYVAEDGEILIESKWGMNSRILHTPEDQPHWQQWRFYHTARSGGHCLNLADDIRAN
jgi:hypothetical protein